MLARAVVHWSPQLCRARDEPDRSQQMHPLHHHSGQLRLCFQLKVRSRRVRQRSQLAGARFVKSGVHRHQANELLDVPRQLLPRIGIQGRYDHGDGRPKPSDPVAGKPEKSF